MNGFVDGRGGTNVLGRARLQPVVQLPLRIQVVQSGFPSNVGYGMSRPLVIYR
jgi:hypothetical protein